MKLLLVSCLLVMGLLTVKAETGVEDAREKPEITKLELVDLGEGESDIDGKDSEVQRKRDSGYSYKRPGGFAPATRIRFQIGQSGNRGRIVNRHSAQTNRPVTKYGPPGYQHPSPLRPTTQSQQHRDKLQFHGGHFGEQQSNIFGNRPNGLQEQGIPSPIRQVDFVEQSPIASQNNEPFASHAANYLPPENQKLPGYSQQQPFSPIRNPADNGQGQSVNFGQSQNLVQQHPQSQPHLSDATAFLTQNAQVIQQLYGAPANDQGFAPNDAPFPGQINQVPPPLGQFENLESSSQNPLEFPSPLPAYASGTLSAQETLEQIQSLEKDRLIVQLQRALASQSQSQNVDAIAGRYAQNQPSFVQSQDLLASLGQRMKIHGLHAQPSTVTVGSGNTAFNQSPFLPGTTISPGLPLSYGVSTTIHPPTTIGTTTSTQPLQTSKEEGTTPIMPATTLSPIATVPLYAGFVPTLISGTSFVSDVPTYGPSFFAPGTVTSVQSSGSSPTHFGIPLPTNQKPATGSFTPSSTPSSTPALTPSTPSTSRPSAPSSPPGNTLALPVHPVVTPSHPVAPLQPLVPATVGHVHPVQTPTTAHHPTYGVQAATAVINPFLYKSVKPVYPLYYYPNVAYQLHKPALPTYPWSYAPTYATQAKPAQIWK